MKVINSNKETVNYVQLINELKSKFKMQLN